MERNIPTRVLVAVALVLLVAPYGAVATMSEYQQYNVVSSVSTASLDISKAGISATGVMMGIVALVVAVYALDVFFNATGEAQESGGWAESGTENSLLNLVETIVVLMLAVAAVGVFMSRRRGRR